MFAFRDSDMLRDLGRRGRKSRRLASLFVECVIEKIGGVRRLLVACATSNSISMISLSAAQECAAAVVCAKSRERGSKRPHNKGPLAAGQLERG